MSLINNGLKYFKKVYGEIPDWVQKMHDYGPGVLEHYTGIRGIIMQNGALSRKEKDSLIASMNAARCYSRSMVYHTKGAIDFGATIPDLVEYFLVSYLYNGVQALKISLTAISYAFELQGKEVSKSVKAPETLVDTIYMLLDWMKDDDTLFVEETLDIVKLGDPIKIEQKILLGGNVSSKIKYLNMIGNYITELRGKDAVPWIEKARNVGASEAELADIGYLCILTAGIPSWFELSDSLKQID